MGVSVREKVKGSGEWWIFINHQGRRKSKRIGRDKKLARDVAGKIEARFILGEMGMMKEKKAPAFKEYADRWINNIILATSKYTTQKDYSMVLKKHVLPIFGKKPISEINRLQVKEFLMKKTCNLSYSSVNRIKIVMSGVFNLAVDDETISINPTYNLGKLLGKKKMNAQTVDFLTRKELSLVLKAFQDFYPDHYPMMLTIARTGCRFGEALGLQWADINFEGRYITIQRSISRRRLTTPKNGKPRRVDMSLQLTETLWKLKRQREREWTKIPEWIFINTQGNPIQGDNWRERVFHKALEKAELHRIKIHTIRHTTASLLLQDGQSMVYVRDQLGHHSINVTVDIYGHLVPGANKEAVDRLDDTNEISSQTAPNPHPIRTQPL